MKYAAPHHIISLPSCRMLDFGEPKLMPYGQTNGPMDAVCRLRLCTKTMAGYMILSHESLSCVASLEVLWRDGQTGGRIDRQSCLSSCCFATKRCFLFRIERKYIFILFFRLYTQASSSLTEIFKCFLSAAWISETDKYLSKPIELTGFPDPFSYQNIGIQEVALQFSFASY